MGVPTVVPILSVVRVVLGVDLDLVVVDLDEGYMYG